MLDYVYISVCLFRWSFRACFVFKCLLCQKRVIFYIFSMFVNPKDVQIKGQNLLRLLFVSLFRGVFSSSFIWFFISKVVKCEFLHVKVCFEFVSSSCQIILRITCHLIFLFDCFCFVLPIVWLPCSIVVSKLLILFWLIVRGINILFIIVRLFCC